MEYEATVHFDGGARPNPGPSAIGCIVDTGPVTKKDSAHIGDSTNNRAEYRALIRGLENALEMDCTVVQAKGDSQLIVKQVRGEWDVNDSELRSLCDRVHALTEQFTHFTISHIPREQNREADQLVDHEFSG